MAVKVMSWVWENGPENATERLVLLALADFADDRGTCWPSMASIATKAGITERGARGVVRRLEAAGWVRTEPNRGRGHSNLYRVLMVKPERETGIENRNDVQPEIVKPERGDHKTGTPLHENRNAGSAEPSRTVKEPSEYTLGPLVIGEFEQVWEHYPRKVGKGAAQKAWLKARRSAPFEAIAKPLGQFIRAVKGTDPQYVPHLATWLNQRRWEDEQDHARNRPRTSTEDIEHLSNLTSTEEVNRLFAGLTFPRPQLRVIGS